MASKKYNGNQKKFADKLFAAYPSYGQDAAEVFAKFAALDPSATAKNEENQYLYLRWICSRVLKESPRVQDLYKIKEDLISYSLLNRLDKYRASRKNTIYYLPFVDPRIEEYSISSLSAVVHPLQTQINDRRKSEDSLKEEYSIAEKNSKIIYDGPEGRIVVPLTMEASQFWGRGTKWCISATKSDNLFDNYYGDGERPILMFLPKGTREKFAFNENDRSSARNMMDVGIIDASKKIDENETDNVFILGNFMASALASPDFKTEDMEANPNLVRAFKLFVIWHPQIYRRIVQQLSNEQIPEPFKLTNILDFCQSYINQPIQPDGIYDSDDTMTAAQKAVHRFASLEIVMTALQDDPAYHQMRQTIFNNLDGVEPEKLAEQIAGDVLIPPEIPFDNPDDYLKDFRSKYQKISEYEGDHARDALSELADKLILEYMASIPREFWTDEKFSFEFLTIGDSFGAEFSKAFPEAYNHPSVLKHFLPFMGPDSFETAFRKYDYSKAWTHKIEGKTFLELAIDMYDCRGRPVIENITDALFLYETLEASKDVDLTPISKKVAALYPNGFNESYEIEYATFQMPRCDFTTTLEKTIAAHPDWFADVAPEKQTLPMAIAAVRHDPGSLADISADLFKGTIKPPELVAAFNKLAVGSTEWQMVEHHFTAPEVT